MAYRSWYGKAQPVAEPRVERATIGGRERLRYRFVVLPPWAPEEAHVVEQAGYCRVKDGQISRLDLVCTGFHPVPESSRARLAADRWRG